MVKKLLIPTLILLLSSCSCDWHLSRIEKKCGKNASIDTLVVHDTLKVAMVRVDTAFKYFQKDTVIVREGRLTMKYFYNNHDSTVFLTGKCDTVFVVKENKVAYTKFSFTKDYLYKYRFYILGVIIIIILFLINKALK